MYESIGNILKNGGSVRKIESAREKISQKALTKADAERELDVFKAKNYTSNDLRDGKVPIEDDPGSQVLIKAGLNAGDKVEFSWFGEDASIDDQEGMIVKADGSRLEIRPIGGGMLNAPLSILLAGGYIKKSESVVGSALEAQEVQKPPEAKSTPESKPETDLEKALREARHEYALAGKDSTDARDKYFAARQAAFAEKEEEYKNSLLHDPFGVTEEQMLVKRSEFIGVELASEFKQLYDEKTEILAAQKEQSGDSKLLQKLRQGAEWYKKLPLKYKLAYSGILLGASFVAGPSTVLAAFIGGGRIVQRIASAGASTIGFEALWKKKQGRAFEDKVADRIRKYEEKFQGAYEAHLKTAQESGMAAGLVEYLQEMDKTIDEDFGTEAERFINKKKWMDRRRWFYAFSVGGIVASGAIGKAIGSAKHFIFGDHGADTLVDGHSDSGAANSGIPKPSAIPDHNVPAAGEITHHNFSRFPSVGEGAVKAMPPETVSGAEHAPVTNVSPETGLSDQGAVSIKPSIPASPETGVLEAVSERNIETIQPGGSVSKAAQELLHKGVMTAEEFKQAWLHSTVEVNGVKVQIGDVSLSHAGDQVEWIKDAAGGGHFEVHEVTGGAHLGTNDDLYNMYHAAHKTPPAWLVDATHHTGASETASAVQHAAAGAHDVAHGASFEGPGSAESAASQGSDAIHPVSSLPNISEPEALAPEVTVPSEALPGNITQAISHDLLTHPHAIDQAHILEKVHEELLKHPGQPYLKNYEEYLQSEIMRNQDSMTSKFAQGALLDQELEIEKIQDLAKHHPGEPFFGKLLEALQNHPAHARELKNYETIWKSFGFKNPEEYGRVKSVKVGEILKHYGRSVFEYFPEDNKIGVVEVGHRRALAEATRAAFRGAVPRSIKNMSVDAFIKGQTRLLAAG